MRGLADECTLNGVVGVKLIEATGIEVVDLSLLVAAVAIWVYAARFVPNGLLCAVAWILGVSQFPAVQATIAVGLAIVMLGIAAFAPPRPAEPQGNGWSAAMSACNAVLAAHLFLRGATGFDGPRLLPVLAMLVLIVAGVICSKSFRVRAVIGSGAAVSLTLWATLGAVTTLVIAAVPIERARTALDQIDISYSTSSLAEARIRLASASDQLEIANAALSSPLGYPIRIVPVLAQHHAVPREIVAGLNEVVETAQDLIDRVDLVDGSTTTGFVNGSLESVAAEVDALATDLSALHGTIEKLSRYRIVPQLRDVLQYVFADLDRAIELMDGAADLAQVMPDLLGMSGPRRYFVAFATPSEARPGLGFIGNFAELTVDRGQLSLTRFGRTADLNAGNSDPVTRVLRNNDAYATRYAPFGAGGGTEPAGNNWWSVVTMSPDMPSVSNVIATLYEQAGNLPLDGVITIDPTGLAELMNVSGPVTVASLGRTFDSSTVEDFLLREQYVLFADQQQGRVDFLEELSQTMLQQLTASSGQDAGRVADALRRGASSGHVTMWSRHPVEQSLFNRLDIAGNFEFDGGRDGLAITQLNSGANKIDAFMRRDIAYSAIVDEGTGEIRATATVTLHNDVPAGLPEYVSGNVRGDVIGTNRCFVNLYSPHQLVGFLMDGIPVDVTTGEELGWRFAEREVLVPAGGKVVLTYELEGTLADTNYGLSVPIRPLALADNFTIKVTSTTGKVLVDHVGPLEVATEFGSSLEPS
jgi:Protein of unknown function (DUF4012)